MIRLTGTGWLKLPQSDRMRWWEHARDVASGKPGALDQAMQDFIMEDPVFLAKAAKP